MDDVNGRVLDKKKIIEARRLEMEFFRKLRVYKKVPRSQVPPGQRIVTTK